MGIWWKYEETAGEYVTMRFITCAARGIIVKMKKLRRGGMDKACSTREGDDECKGSEHFSSKT
jgi:hypothetical protein